MIVNISLLKLLSQHLFNIKNIKFSTLLMISQNIIEHEYFNEKYH